MAAKKHFSIDEIIENQNKFREEIIEFFEKDFSQLKKIFNSIKVVGDDNDIAVEKERLGKKIKKIGPSLYKHIKKFFVSPSNKHPKICALWDVEREEIILYNYAKSTKKK